MALALNRPMDPVRSPSWEILQAPVWEMPLTPATSQEAKDAESSRLGECTTVPHDAGLNLYQPELKFLTTTGPPSQRSKEARLVVRSHAMQAFLREKKLDGKHTAKNDPNLQVKSLDEAVGRFKLSTWSRKSSKKAPSTAIGEGRSKKNGSELSTKISQMAPIRTLKPIPSPQSVFGQLDPFGIIPVVLTPTMQNLLLYYTTEFTMNSVAVNPEGKWLSFALTDAALLHATLALVAYHRDITHGREESLECLYQKGEAIRRMNVRLGDSHQQFSDSTVAVVSLFVNIETMNGSRPISDVHMTALQSMVAERGGVDGFDNNRVLQRVLQWADIIYSSTWNCTPRFTFPKSSRHEDSISCLEKFSSSNYSHLLDYDTSSWCQSNPIMRHVLEGLRRISTAASLSDLSNTERAAVSNQIYILEHAVLSSPNTIDVYASGYNMETDLSDPFRIASLLYSHVILRELPHTAKMHSKVVFNLKSALEEQAVALVHTTSQKTLELLAWIFFIGAAASADARERKYFVTLLVRVCSGLGLQGRSSLKKTLQGIVWLERVCAGYFDVIWKEMTLM